MHCRGTLLLQENSLNKLSTTIFLEDGQEMLTVSSLRRWVSLWLNGLLISHFCYYLNWKTAIRRDEGSWSRSKWCTNITTITMPRNTQLATTFSKPVFKIAILEWVCGFFFCCSADWAQIFWLTLPPWGARTSQVWVVRKTHFLKEA